MVGQIKAIAILAALSAIASFFYYTLWVTLDPEKPSPSHSQSDPQDQEFNTILHKDSHGHVTHKTNNKHSLHHGPSSGKDDTGVKKDSFPQYIKRPPFLVPVNELRAPALPELEQQDPPPPPPPPPAVAAASVVVPPQVPSSSSSSSAPEISLILDFEKEPLQPGESLKTRKNRLFRQQQKLEKLERQRQKALRLERQRQRMVEEASFPSLISTNNARVSKLHSEAFARFCNLVGKDEGQEASVADRKKDEMRQKGESEERLSEGSQREATLAEPFKTFEEWMEFVRNKNKGQDQDEGTLDSSFASSALEQAQDAASDQQPSAPPPPRPPKRPLFMERPLPGWIVNRTELLRPGGPCDRIVHTSAHCLAYLAQDHRYLVPSPKARQVLRTRHPMDAANPPTLVPGTSSTAEETLLKKEDEEEDENDEDVVNQPEQGSATRTPLSLITPMDFHIFWRGPITDKIALSAHSFLFTQPLERARLHLWIDSTDLPGGQPEDYTINPHSAPLITHPVNRYIVFHAWDQAAEEAFSYPASSSASTQGTVDTREQQGPIEPQQETSTPTTKSIPPVALSDEARFLILNRLGGIYLDADVLLLRDMAPFYDAEIEFAYEWSNTRMYNTAIMRLLPGSTVARRILDGAKAREKEIIEKRRIKALRAATVAAAAAGTDEESIGLHRQQHHHHRLVDAKGIDAKKKSERPSRKEQQHARGRSRLQQMSIVNDITQGDGETQDSSSSSSSSSFPSTGSPNEDASNLSTITPHRLVKRGEMRPEEIYHPARLRSYLRPPSTTTPPSNDKDESDLRTNGLTMFGPAIFDPLWLRVDQAESPAALSTDPERMVQDLQTFPDAFKGFSSPSNLENDHVCPRQDPQNQQSHTTSSKQEQQEYFAAGPEVFLTGAYAYHWHNNWLTPIDPSSWMGLMRQAYEDFVSGQRPNLYGEWFKDGEVL